MHLFFPSHDLALANGLKHFNPPAAALRLEEDLAPLAAIWNQWLEQSSFSENAAAMPLPWGWDYDTRALLNRQFGVKMKFLPSDDDLRLLRELSSRRTTIGILSRLKSACREFDHIELPLWLDSDEAFDAFVGSPSFADASRPFILKTPWSSSGRGIARSDVWQKDAMARHAKSTIRKQGGVVAEPFYQKTQDLAQLFFVGRDGVRFVGYSIFENDENGTYRYGELMSDALMSASLPPVCDSTRDLLLPILHDLFRPFFGKPWVVGFVGIDMMLLTPQSEFGGEGEGVWEGGERLHPCVEMNVRCTMGVVARLFFDQTFGPDSDAIGEFYVSPATDSERLAKLDSDFRDLYGQRYHRLTALSPDSMFMAYAIMS